MNTVLIKYKSSCLLFLAGVFVFALNGCSRKIDQSLINPGATLEVNSPNSRDQLRVDFMGVAAFAIRYQDKLVLTDPFVSNPPAGKVMFGKITSDTVVVNQFYNRLGLEDVKITLVGHAHYDHLLDLPPLLDKIPGDAVVVGSQTTKNILAACNPTQIIIPADNLTGSPTTPGNWIYSPDSSVRVMPFESDHLPHMMGIELYKGDYTEPLTELPTKAKHWKCGMVISYLIDFMEGPNVKWRVFFHSSSPKSDMGRFPAMLLGEKSVDVAISSVALNSNDYILSVAELYSPKAIFLAHWDNFFQAKEPPYKGVSRSNINKIYRELDSALDTPLILAEPGSTFLLR